MIPYMISEGNKKHISDPSTALFKTVGQIPILELLIIGSKNNKNKQTKNLLFSPRQKLCDPLRTIHDVSIHAFCGHYR